MRWPFGPPHLTLKPSKKKQNKKKQKKKQNKKRHKKTKKKKNQERKRKKHKNTKKRAFQLSVKIFFFFDRVSKNCLFLTPWPRKRAPKNTIKIGVSAFFFGKKLCVTKRPFLDKKTQIHKFQLSFFFLPFFLFQKQKTQKSAETPIFIVF